jgi:hypothetical protein
MLSTDLQSIADTLMARALTGAPLTLDEVRTLATTVNALALIASAMEATKITQEAIDAMARIMAEHEGEQG